MSAVSMKLKSTAKKPSRILNDPGSSSVQPKTFPPRHSGLTSIPEFPNLRSSGTGPPNCFGCEATYPAMLRRRSRQHGIDSQQRTGFLKLEPRSARKELGIVAIPQIAKKIRLHMTYRKELLFETFEFLATAEKFFIHFRVVEPRHRTAVKSQRSRSND